MKNRLLRAGVSALVLGLASTSLHATILGVSPSEFAPSALLAPSGPVLGTIGPTGFVSALGVGDFAGVYVAAAFADINNVFAPGDVTIAYQFAVTGGSADISRVTASDFGAFGTVDAGFVSGTGIIPDLVDRITGGPVGFDFIGGIGGGFASAELLIETNGVSLVPGNFSLIDDGTSTNPGFSAAVPEASTWAMMLAGFALLGAFGWRKKWQDSGNGRGARRAGSSGAVRPEFI